MKKKYALKLQNGDEVEIDGVVITILAIEIKDSVACILTKDGNYIECLTRDIR